LENVRFKPDLGGLFLAGLLLLLLDGLFLEGLFVVRTVITLCQETSEQKSKNKRKA
jgi:hypothetical protein